MNQKILGVRVDLVNENEILDQIDETIRNNQKLQIATVNNEFIVEAQKNSQFKSVLDTTNLNICDSTGLCYALRLFYGKRTARIPGADLFETICAHCQKNDYSVFFLGGKKSIASRAASRVNQRYKNLKIVGVVDGIAILPNQKNPALIEQINRSGANIVFVALGAPKQELWIANNLKDLNANCFLGIGGTLDYVSGDLRRAPAWVRRIGMEWFVRLIRQPSRFARIWRATVVFPLLVIKQKISKRDS